MTDALLELIKQVSSIQDTLDYLRSLDSGSGGGGTVTAVTASAPLASSGGTTPNITHNTSGVAAATVTNATITTDLTGHVTAASSGTAPVTSVGVTAPITSTGGTTPTIGLSVTPANPGGAVALQATTPGTQQTGHIHVSGAGIFGTTGLTANEAVLALNQSATNATIDATNSSASGSAIKAQNSSGTVAPLIVTNSSIGPAIQAVTSSGGIGFTASYSNTNNMAEFRNSGTGKGMLATSTSGTTVDATATTGSAGVFANNGAGTTVTATNSGAGDGLLGTTANNAQFGVKGTNTASTDGAGAGGKFDGGTHTVGAIITTNHATKEALTLTNPGGGPGLVTPNTKINGVLYTVDTFANRPGSPATGDIHYATDRHIEYYYDGTRWLSTFTRTSPLTAFSAFVNNVAATANASMRAGVLDPTYGYYVESLVFTFHVLTTFDATNRWTITLNKTNSAAASAAVLTSQALWQTGRAINVEYADSFAINTAYLVTDAYQWFLDLTKVNAPGNLAVVGTYLIYRLVG